MIRWQVCHQSGRVLFTTDNELTARNREQFGWKVIKVDKSREQFEAEMAKLGDCVDMRRAKNGDEEYMEWDVRLAWKMWQVSRSAIEIDLGPDINPLMFKDDVLFGYHKAKSEIASRLGSIGLKVRS